MNKSDQSFEPVVTSKEKSSLGLFSVFLVALPYSLEFIESINNGRMSGHGKVFDSGGYSSLAGEGSLGLRRANSCRYSGKSNLNSCSENSHVSDG